MLVPALFGCNAVSCETERGVPIELSQVGAAEEWPRALVPDLEPATPATEVTVHVDRVEITNRELVATWPAGALERARTEGSREDPEWPRIVETLDRPAAQGMRIPRLQEVLARARRAERAATGAGTGAGVFNLRVASNVPYAHVERILYTAAQVGYGGPRLLLDAGETERVLPWPSARPRGAPSREAIEAALRGEAVEEPAQLAGPEVRLALEADRAELRSGANVLCTIDGALDHARLGRCARRAEVRGAIVLAVDPELPFARVAAAVQSLAGAFEEVRVIRATR